MRLHHLSITAFGPFAGTVEVDFDALSDAGLFLLTGATGAGKTSVLDAVCFALYGQVPGDRAGAKHLRSDHAAPDVVPEVTLRLSIGVREFSFTRSPAWFRQKKRGSGVTKVQARVLVEELLDETWVVRSNRLDDAGLLVSSLLGMSSTQFTQVAMLPQGRFQAFLRASSAERHSVLQQLFRTDRFERIEGWLVQRRTAAHRTAESAATGVRDTFWRFQEASTTAVAPEWAEDLSKAVSSGDLERWVHQVDAASFQQAAGARLRSDAADAGVAESERVLAAARDVIELRARGTAALETTASWEQRADELLAARDRVAAHQAAVPLRELATACATARETAQSAGLRFSAAIDVVDLRPEDVDRTTLLALQRDAQEAHAAASAFVPRVETLRAALDRRGRLRARLQAIETEVSELERVLARQPGLIAESVATVHEARSAAARIPVLQAQADRLQATLAGARRAEILRLELTVAKTDVLAATGAALAAKDQYLDLREARVNAMAGELASQLASGCSCPVCGSSDHPAPAPRDERAVGRTEEDLARKSYEDADFQLQAQQVRLATLEGELASLQAQVAGADPAAVTAELEVVRDEVERLEPLVAALDVLVRQESSARELLVEAESAQRKALLERAEIGATLAEIDESVEATHDAWVSLSADRRAAPYADLAADVADLIRARQRDADAVGRALSAHDEQEAALRQAEALGVQLADAARDAGFPDAPSATAALLQEPEITRLRDLLGEADTALAGASMVLADPEVASALATPPPDLDALLAEHARATNRAREAVSDLAAAQARRDRLEVLGAELLARAEAWRPLQEQYRLVADLAAFVEGKSVDNLHRMRLAAYVLAERLRQVVAAANERLVAMTDHRYALEHTDDRGYGEQRGGLSLRIRDDWNGVHRDPATLSGGETFVVSLALALGLADTVAHEAGGTDIDTLFIDEGFGSLDSETLEDVMDTLDSLRDGGRVVGLVSHVPELRSRITTQLEVTKGRGGSSLRPTVATG